ncbi:unnamed protein product, partial [Mesorhabditis spiculigera]
MDDAVQTGHVLLLHVLRQVVTDRQKMIVLSRAIRQRDLLDLCTRYGIRHVPGQIVVVADPQLYLDREDELPGCSNYFLDELSLCQEAYGLETRPLVSHILSLCQRAKQASEGDSKWNVFVSTGAPCPAFRILAANSAVDLRVEDHADILRGTNCKVAVETRESQRLLAFRVTERNITVV